MINDALKKELEDFKNKRKDRLGEANNDTRDKDRSNERLMKELNDLKQMYGDLFEKHATIEQKFAEEKKNQEKIMEKKIDEYKTQMILAKSKSKLLK